ELVAVSHVNQYISFCIAPSDDLHFLEEERSALAEDHIALRELVLELDRAILTTGERNVGRLFGEAQSARDASLFRNGVVAGDSFDDRIIDAVHGKFVVWSQQFECR